MASSSWIWITPPHWNAGDPTGARYRYVGWSSVWVAWNFTRNHRGNLQSCEYCFLFWKGRIFLEWYSSLEMWSFQLTFHLRLNRNLCASFLHDWINENCVDLSLSAWAKTLGASPPLEDCLGCMSSEGCILWLEVIVMPSRLMHLYVIWKELASWNGASKMGHFSSPLL